MKVKICCIQSPREAITAIRHGADALGLVGPMPSGPGPVPLDLIARISADIPRGTDSFYLTSKTETDAIANEYEMAATTHLQLTDNVTPEVRIELKKRFEKLKIVQVLHVTGPDDLALAQEYAETSDMLLLDSGAPDKSIKELGGTGRTHDWEISQSIIETLDIPVFLAGGLNAGNVKEAVQTVRPYGVDLCSGVRTNGILDISKLAAFFDALRSS